MNYYLQLFSFALIVLIGVQTTYLTMRRSGKIKRKAGVAIMVDTSVLIDGRIISIARSGFISGALIVPRSVVAELQYMADNADHDKRTRARYGLDVIHELQQLKNVTLQILQDNKGTREVDTQLVELAKQHNAELCTIDYNLNKVAQVEGVVVLNVNELAQALRATHLPGERRMLELVQKGSESHQAVGYLEDGTMVVVEHSGHLIGQAVEIEFTRVLQTQAGKMMFAKRIENTKKGQPQAAATSKSLKTEGKKRHEQKTRQEKPTRHKSQHLASPNSAKTRHKKPQATQKRKAKKTHEDALIELANSSDD